MKPESTEGREEAWEGWGVPRGWPLWDRGMNPVWGAELAESPPSPGPALTLRGREAEHDHSGDGAVLQDCPCLQDLCGEGEDSGLCPQPPAPGPGPHPGCHLGFAGPRGQLGHNHSDSQGRRVAGTCWGGCGHQARGRWWVGGGQWSWRASPGPGPIFSLSRGICPLPVALGPHWRV